MSRLLDMLTVRVDETILDAVNAFVLGARPGEPQTDRSLRERQRRK